MENLTTLTSIVHNNPAGMSLLDYLCKRFPYKTESGWVESINAGQVVINGKITTPDQNLVFKDTVSYTSQRNEPAVATDIETLFEDEHILVVNKPAPLPVHADGIFIINTLIYIIRQRTGNQNLSLGHRLDRDTTGILVLAKDKKLTTKLMAKFEEATTEKWYLAVARGEADFQEKLIRGWMGPKATSQIRIRQHLLDQKTEGYKESATRFLLQEHLKNYSLLACEMLSGRTNQIRVHLEAAGFPLAGDKLYGRTDEEFLRYLNHFKKIGTMNDGSEEHPRHLLHAWKLSMNHPVTGVRMEWQAPMPNDMREFIKQNQS